MKKLIIVAALAIAGSFANAAVVDWTFTCATKGATYYVFNGDYSSAVVAALGNTETGGTAAFNTYISGLASSAYTTGTTAGTKGASGKFSDPSANLTFVIFESGIKDGNDYSYTTMSTSGMTYDPDAQEASPGKVKFDYKGGEGTDGTVAEAVPEPTSGILLLLGMAGLALRRRHA